MRTSCTPYSLIGLAALAYTGSLWAGTVVPVPEIPSGQPSTIYTVKVNGQPVPVNDESRFDFQTAAFCMSGTVQVEVTSNSGASGFSVRPLRHKIQPKANGNSIAFQLTEPLKLVVQANGQPPLALIATPLEEKPPTSTEANVLYFGPGVHDAGVIRPTTGQTVYLAPGALVKGRIECRDAQNVTLKGRGILDTGKYSIRNQKTPGVIFERCSNVTVEGIGVRGGTWWQSLFLLTKDAEIRHAHLLGKSVNTDGIDIDGAQRFTAKHCFIRSEDDGFGWHAVDAKTNGEEPTRDCLAEDCVIWNSGAGNGLRIGASMESQLFENITFRNIDVLAHSGAAIYSDHSDWAWCKKIKFENFIDETSGPTVKIFIAKTHYSNDNNYRDERGHFEDLEFKNLTSAGGKIVLQGFDQDHRIDGVVFDNCKLGSTPVKSLQDISVNGFVTNVSFKGTL